MFTHSQRELLAAARDVIDAMLAPSTPGSVVPTGVANTWAVTLNGAARDEAIVSLSPDAVHVSL